MLIKAAASNGLISGSIFAVPRPASLAQQVTACAVRPRDAPGRQA